MTESLAGPLSAFLACCTWAVGVSSYSRLSRTYAPSTVNTTRAVVAGTAFALFVLVTAGGPAGALATLAAVGTERAGFLALSILASFAIGDAIFLRATVLIGVPAALAIASTYPLWAALVGVVVRGEPLGPARLAGVVAIVGGTILVILASRGRAEGPRGEPGARRHPAVGVLLALTTSVLWAVNSFAMREGGRDLSPAVASLIRMASALVLCPTLGLVLARVLGRSGDRPAPSRFVVGRADFRRTWWAFVVEGIGGALFFAYGLSRTPLAVGAALSALSPVVAVPIAVATGAEPFSRKKLLGILIVVLGVALVVR